MKIGKVMMQGCQVERDQPLEEWIPNPFNIERELSIIKRRMRDDNPSKPGSLAHAWHCNIAMPIFDTMKELQGQGIKDIDVANIAATRIMQILFEVDTSQSWKTSDERK